MSSEDAFVEAKSEYPFDLEKAKTGYQGWRLAARRIDDAAALLNFPPLLKLQGAPGGGQYPTNGEEPPNLGKRVFVQSRDRCHSRKLPEGYTREGTEKYPEEAKADGVKVIMRGDFMENNFLSEDRRYPLCSDNPGIAIGANAVRAVTSNSTKGRIRQSFSSKTSKELPFVGKAAFYNPFNPDHSIEHEFPAGGRDYCRTPSLINTWAAAPLFYTAMCQRSITTIRQLKLQGWRFVPVIQNRRAALSISAWVIFHKAGEQ